LRDLSTELRKASFSEQIATLQRFNVAPPDVPLS
jgi:hypothetical protein